MKSVISVLIFLFSLHHIRCSSDSFVSNKEEDSDIFYQGFINNESYEHYLPSKYPENLRDKNFITMNCHKGYTVAIRSARIVDLNEEEHDFTLMAQNQCENKEQCKIDVQSFKRHTGLPNIDYSTELTVEFICKSALKPLFDGNRFHQGVTRKFLIIRDRSIDCVQKKAFSYSSHSITKALEKCDKEFCKQVIWDDEEKKAVICHEQSSNNIIEKKGSIIYMNPDNFHMDGYAVFINYMSLCENTLKSVPYNLDMEKSVDVCSHLECNFFSKSFSGSIKSLKSNKNGKSWFCKGFPTLIPMDGFVTSVKTN